MSLECPQFCMVRPFHTQTSRIAPTHPHTTHSHTHTTWKELWPCPPCPQYTSVFQSEISALHSCVNRRWGKISTYIHSCFKILSVSVYFFFSFIKGDMNIFSMCHSMLQAQVCVSVRLWDLSYCIIAQCCLHTQGIEWSKKTRPFFMAHSVFIVVIVCAPVGLKHFSLVN